MKKLFLLIGLVVIGSALVLLLQSESEQNEPSADVAATIYPIYDITRSIAGDALNVGLVLPAGASPHTFEPTPSLVRKLSDASVVYAIGHGFDDWVDSVIETVESEKFIVDGGVKLREAEEHEEEGGHHGEEDPHYWLSVTHAIVIASNIKTDLSSRYPEYEETFTINLADYSSKLVETDLEIRRVLGEIENRGLITLHDAWYYFAEEYDLDIVGTFEPTAGREPTPQYLADLIGAIEASQATTLYTEPQLGTDSLTSFLADYNLSLAELDPIGGQSNETYIEMMLQNAQTIANNQ